MKTHYFSLLLVASVFLGCTAKRVQTDSQTSVNQSEPVVWNFTAVKVGKNQYDLNLKASIGKGWHLYSQFLPDAEIRPVPTTITFEENAAVKLEERADEKGHKEEVYDPNFEMKLTYYSEEATFTQRVTLLKPVSTIKGNVEFMVCDDEKCLPPAMKDFTFTVKYDK